MGDEGGKFQLKNQIKNCKEPPWKFYKIDLHNV